jgi:hypothetical protein
MRRRFPPPISSTCAPRHDHFDFDLVVTKAGVYDPTFTASDKLTGAGH